MYHNSIFSKVAIIYSTIEFFSINPIEEHKILKKKFQSLQLTKLNANSE